MNTEEDFKKELDALLIKYNLSMEIERQDFNNPSINFYRHTKFDKNHNELYPTIDIYYGAYHNPNIY